MDELVERSAAKAAVDKTAAEKAAGINLDFLRTEGPVERVQKLIDRIPGAEAAITASGAFRGGFLGSPLMALGGKLMGLGLGMGEIQGFARELCFARELFRFGRDRNGADKIATIIAGTPGLSQFA